MLLSVAVLIQYVAYEISHPQPKVAFFASQQNEISGFLERTENNSSVIKNAKAKFGPTIVASALLTV